MAARCEKHMTRSQTKIDDLSTQGNGIRNNRLTDNQTENQSAEIDENLKYELQQTFWVQCDEITCRKWRRIQGRDALRKAEAEPRWTCRLHPDPRFRSCAVAEEDTAEYDRLANTVGLIYVKDWLPLGSLVWARLPGFCSWPAVVSGDGSYGGQYLERDEVGGAYSYHVEFLGPSHSHSWVRAPSVLEFIPGLPAPVKEPHRSKSKGSGRGGKRGRGAYDSHKPKPRCPQGLDEAVREASALVHLSLDERLSRCHFHAPAGSETKENVTVTVETPVTRSSGRTTQEKGGRGRPRKQQCQIQTRTQAQTVTGVCSQAALCGGRRGRVSGASVERKSVALQTESLPSDSPLLHPRPCTRQQDAATKKPAQDALSSTLTFQSHSLVNRTKEERLCLDIEMYRRNERAFEHDVNRLRLRHNLDLIRSRKWSSRPVSPFQVFLSVHNRGGFLKVKQSRQWAAIYQELTDTQVSSGHCVASYYYRYLYAYELFVKGLDYDHVIGDNMLSQRKKKREKETEKNSPAPPVTEENSVSPSGEELFSDEDDCRSTACRQDIQRALYLLDRNETLSCIEQDVGARERATGVRVVFAGQSPVFHPDPPPYREALHELRVPSTSPSPQCPPQPPYWGQEEQVVPGEESSLSEVSIDTLLALSELQSCLRECHKSLLEL